MFTGFLGLFLSLRNAVKHSLKSSYSLCNGGTSTIYHCIICIEMKVGSIHILNQTIQKLAADLRQSPGVHQVEVGKGRDQLGHTETYLRSNPQTI